MSSNSSRDSTEKVDGLERVGSLGSESSYDHNATTAIANNLHVKAHYGDGKQFDGPFGWFWKMSYFIDSLGEARGVDRQPENARGKGDLRQFWAMSVIWVGATCSLPSMTGFFIGPLVFNLGFKDSMSAGILGVTVGCAFASFGALSGPRSGLRQMISTRFQFGWWPAKFVALLNILTLLGWSVVSLVFGGQLLNAINPNIPLQISILIISIISVVVSVFGIRIVIIFDKIFVVPTVIVFMLVYVCTASEYPTQSKSIGATDRDIQANWLSFFSSCIGITSTWVAMTSDYCVDLPADIHRGKLYFFIFTMLLLPTVFVGIIGIGVASAAKFSNEAWGEAYENLGSGGLLATSVNKWHGGGRFLVVMMFITLITNNTMGTYSIPLSAQVFGRIWTKVPRYILSIITGVLYFVLASAGRNKLYDILSNFMPMIAYWSMIYCTILIVETFLFRRRPRDEPQWEHWNEKSHFPIMWASILSFCAGAAGVVVGMDQTYYTGVIARKLGSEGADLGVVFAVAFSLVTYIPLRAIEISIRKDRPIRP